MMSSSRLGYDNTLVDHEVASYLQFESDSKRRQKSWRQNYQTNENLVQHQEWVATKEEIFRGFDLEVPCVNMKVKELDLTANVAWSPAANNPILLATGTAAQQLDATFSTNSALEIYALNLQESGHQMPKMASYPVEHRYHKLIWGEAGMEGGARPNGVIVGGLDQGTMTLYDAHKLLVGQNEGSVIGSSSKHTGPVQSLDFNPYQHNLIASGASESEIFIWDVNKLATPMTPGAKSQPLDDVRCVAWNKQVQHILATTFASRCVVWDLRKNEPIIKVSDSTSRMRKKVVAWHPDVATQLCLASEDDHTPIIQIWDLRLASSPLKTLENHQRGILSVVWCQQDSDLLLSCGKDNRILCWNANSNEPGGEVLCELSSPSQWSFDLAWCPRNPAVIASSSFDGQVSIYSLMGGQQQAEPSPSIADSFPGMERIQQPAAPPTTTVQLKKPPKWLKRPCGASFGFGGKLVNFEFVKPPANQAQNQQQVQQPRSIVHLSKVITEPELVERSQKLETSIQNQNVPEFCDLKISTAQDEAEKQLWKFIRANFEGQNKRFHFLDLLEHSPSQVAQQIESLSGVRVIPDEDGDGLANGMDSISDRLSVLDTTTDRESAFEAIAAKTKSKDDEEYDVRRQRSFQVVTDDSEVGLLSKALLSGNLELAVELCVKQNRTTDAIILASQAGAKILEKTQKRYFAKCNSNESYLIEAVVTGDWSSFVQRCSRDNWKEALISTITYAPDEHFADICTSIGDRLAESSDSNNSFHLGQMLCYTCAGNLDKLVESWMRYRDTSSGSAVLQDMVEVIMSLKVALEQTSGCEVEIPSGPLSAKLSEYASLLASQGAMNAALAYLGNSSEESIAMLRNRVSGALGKQQKQRRQSSSSTRHAPLSRRKSSGPGYTGGYQVPSYETNQTSYYDPRRTSATPDPFAPMPPPSNPGFIPDQGGPGHTPPVSSGPGWNDPPPMISSSKPRPNSIVKSSSVYGRGSEGADQQQTAPIKFFIPQAPAEQKAPSTPPTNFMNPMMNQPSSVPPPPTKAELKIPSAPPPTSTPSMMYGPQGGPPKISSYGPPRPPSASGPPPPPTGNTSVSMGGYGDPPSFSNPTPSKAAPTMIGPPQSSQFGPSSMYGTSQTNQFGPAPTSNMPALGPPPASNFGASQAGPAPPSSLAAPPTSGFGPPPTSSYASSRDPTSRPPPASNFGQPPRSSIGPPPSSTYGAPPTSSYNFDVSSGSNIGSSTPSSYAGPTSSGFVPSDFGAPPRFNQELQSANWNATSSLGPPPSMRGPNPQSFLNPMDSRQEQSQGPMMPPPGPPGGANASSDFNIMTPAPPQSSGPKQSKPQVQEPEPPKEKGPIPREHQILQETFDSLYKKCLESASHPHLRRKLDDVSQNLDVLYDKLRDGSLNDPNILSGLHNITHQIKAFDYRNALVTVNQMIENGSFSVLGDFMPGVKVLIQVATQLNVYLASY